MNGTPEHRGDRLSRRGFVAGAASVGLLVGCGRLPSQGQPAQRVARIGWLQEGPRSDSSPTVAAFRQGLRELGYTEGHNVIIEYRSAEGQRSRVPELTVELGQLPVDVILAVATAADGVASATSTMPVVMVYPADPVASGLVASLARPGGNVTGLTYFAGQLQQKRLELLRQTVPGLSRVAVVQEGGREIVARDFQIIEAAARTLGVRLQRLEVDGPSELDAAFESATREGADGLLLGGGNLFVLDRSRLVALAAQHQLPTMYFLTNFVRAGGLMAYAANIEAHFYRAAYYVDRILRGAKPGDLPVEQPMTFEFVVNMKTAAALGLTFPNEIMLQVTEVIQ